MWFDLIVLAILLLSVWLGASRGFIWQLATIAALVLGFAFAESFSVVIAPYITVKAPLNRWIAMLILYIVFSFLAFGIARQLRDWLIKIRFIEYDRHLGALFGLVKGGVICLVLTFFSVTLSASLREHVMLSFSGKASAIIMDRLHPVMPDELHTVIDPYIHQLDSPDLDLRNRHTPGNERDHDEPLPDESRITVPGHSPDVVGHQLTELVERLIGETDPVLIQSAVHALRNTRDEDRAELVALLGSRIPGVIRATVEEWQDGKPNISGSSEIERLLRDISGIYFTFPRSQDVFIEEIESQLEPLSDGVQLLVLRDMYADLLNEDPDPDPGTDYRSTLDERISRQRVRSSSSSFDPGFPWN